MATAPMPPAICQRMPRPLERRRFGRIDALDHVAGSGHTVRGSWLRRCPRRLGQRLTSAAGGEDSSPDTDDVLVAGLGPVAHQRSSGWNIAPSSRRYRTYGPSAASSATASSWVTSATVACGSASTTTVRTGSSPPGGRAPRVDRPRPRPGEGEPRRDVPSWMTAPSDSSERPRRRCPPTVVPLADWQSSSSAPAAPEVDRGVHPRHGRVVEPELARRVPTEPHAVAQPTTRSRPSRGSAVTRPRLRRGSGRVAALGGRCRPGGPAHRVGGPGCRPPRRRRRPCRPPSGGHAPTGRRPSAR